MKQQMKVRHVLISKFQKQKHKSQKNCYLLPSVLHTLRERACLYNLIGFCGKICLSTVSFRYQFFDSICFIMMFGIAELSSVMKGKIFLLVFGVSF